MHAFATRSPIRNSGDVTGSSSRGTGSSRTPRAGRGGARPRRRRPPAAAQAGRGVRVHELDAAWHAAGTMRGTHFCMTDDARPSRAPVALFVAPSRTDLRWRCWGRVPAQSAGLGPPALLTAADANALAERNLWLVRVVEWLRRMRRRRAPTQWQAGRARLRHLLNVLDRHPDDHRGGRRVFVVLRELRSGGAVRRLRLHAAGGPVRRTRAAPAHRACCRRR